MQNAVYCIAQNHAQAETIVDGLKRAGFPNNEISVLMTDKSRTRDFAHEKNTKMPEGATTGGATGMGVGAVLGWLAGIGSLAIPGVGPFIAAGPIMGALGGAAVGGAAGGIVGALVGMGIPEYEAKEYDKKIRGGNALISVHTDNAEQVRTAKEIYTRAGAEDIAEASVPHSRTETVADTRAVSGTRARSTQGEIMGSDRRNNEGPGPRIMAADSLDSEDVTNTQGEDLGTIEHIMIDVPTGRVAYAVMSFGGVAGMGDKLFAVPWNALRLDTDNKCFVLDVPKERLEQAEGFDKDHWPSMADQRWATEIHRYYSARPYWE